MGYRRRKIRRAIVRLDSMDIDELPFEEIKWILRGADELIVRGGRSLLAKILKGSKDKKILSLKLDKSPVYGYYKGLTIKEITAKIDWVIENGFLTIRYDGRLPLLEYTGKGWEIEKDTYSDELLSNMDKMLESSQDIYDMTYMKDRNRKMILMLLDKIEATGDPKYIPILRSWEKIDYKKVMERIRKVIQTISLKLMK